MLFEKKIRILCLWKVSFSTFLYSFLKLKIKKKLIFPLKLLIRKEKVTFLICEAHSKLQEE